MSLLVWQAFLKLILFDLYLARGDFQALYRKVEGYPVSGQPDVRQDAERICAAMDLACACYWKQVLCLQRSAATTCQLKQHGIRAHLVVGTRLIPFRAHAWVEVNNRVVNDKLSFVESYIVLDRI
jgi:hypothetical protein